MVLKRAVALTLVVSVLFVGWDVRPSEATHVVTELGTFNLTASGVSKLSRATEKVRAAATLMQIAGRWAGPVSLVFAIAEIGMRAWDWYGHTYTKGTTPSVLSGGYWQFGYNGGYAVLTAYGISECDGKFTWGQGVYPATIPWGRITGIRVSTTVCGINPTRYTYLYDLYYTAVSGGVAATAVSYEGGQNTKSREAAINDLVAYRDWMQANNPLPAEAASLAASAAAEEGGVPVVADPRSAVISVLNDAISVLNHGEKLSVPADATMANAGREGPLPSVVPDTGETPVGTGFGITSATGGGTDLALTNQKLDQENQTLEEMKDAAPSPAPAFACASCDRVTSWATLMSSWQTAIAGAPIFGLIAQLVWPGSGTVERVWTLGSWQGGSLSVNLDDSGLGTVIAVVRFVVIGGAIVVAYMIIFG